VERVDSEMLHILSMDSKAYVGYSEFVHLWYVHTRLEEGGDGVLCSIGSHSNTPDASVHECFMRLQAIQPTQAKPDAVIVKEASSITGERTHYRWNGACFGVVPQPYRPDDNG
jgi:hypothetical protein